MNEQLDKSIEIISGAAERKITVRVWKPKNREPKSVLVISHGMGEHIDRYEGFADVATEKCVAVIGANHRGHGQEATLHGHFDDERGWERVLADLDCIVDYARVQFACPVILIGHSMGSFVARHYAILHGAKLEGLVLCGSNYQSPLLLKTAKAIALSQVKLFNKRRPSALMEFLSFGVFNLSVKKPRTAMDWLNRNNAEVDKYIVDPLCGFRCSNQFWVDFMGGLAWSSHQEHLKHMPSELPVLVTSGDRDPVSRMGKGAQALQQALRDSGVSKVDLKLYTGARHELFLEVNRQEFYQDLLNWVSFYSIRRPLSATLLENIRPQLT